MNGGIAVQLSIVKGMSVRGNDTLTMCPVICGVPPVAAATAFGSMSAPKGPASFAAASMSAPKGPASFAAASDAHVAETLGLFELEHDGTKGTPATMSSDATIRGFIWDLLGVCGSLLGK